MTQPAETFDSYDARGNREDLQDKIYMVSPEKTPVTSAIKRIKVTNRLHEWQRDSLATPNKDNAVIEGDDRVGTAITATDRVANTTQLFDKVVIVSEAQRKSNPAGRSDEMKYQLAMKAYPELKRDVEAMVVSNNVAVQGSGTVARASAGFGRLVYTNISHGGSGATPAHTTGLATSAITAGTNRTFTDTLLKTVMQSIYTNSGEMPSMVSLTPAHKVVFSGFSGLAQNRRDVKGRDQAVIVGGADVYVSDFGDLTIVPNYVQATANNDTALIINPEQLALGVFNPMNSRPLAKTGHADKELASIECTLVVQSQSAQGKIANLTP
jgi:hypothetical protein